MYFFDIDSAVFLVDGIHIIPKNAIKISEGDFYNFISKREQGAVIYAENGQVKATPPKPDRYHTWNGKKWILTKESQNELLMQKKSVLLQELVVKGTALRAKHLAGYSVREEQEARGNAPIMLLDELFATGRYGSMDELKAAIIAKVDTLAIIEGALVAQEDDFKQRIQVAEDNQLDAIRKEIEQWR